MQDKIKIINDYFKGLEFEEETHKYLFNSKPIKVSVSGVISNYYEKFDSEFFAQKVADRDGKTKEEVLQEWKDIAKQGTDLGSRVHLFGEFYPFDRTMVPKDGYEEAIVKFWNNLPEHIVPIMMELRMVHKEYLFAGTADILLYNTKTDTFIIGDYKTNKDLFKNFKGKKMLGPFRELLDCSFNKYQLQLSYYQLLFEQLGLKVSGRKLIWLLPNGNYEMYDLTDYTEVLKNDLPNLNI